MVVYLMIFLYGIIIGSFLNVCIYRIPKKENIVTTRSHCMACGYQLKWYDLIPIFSFVILRGRCRKCGEKVSIQYPLIELANGVLWVLTFAFCGFQIETILYCLMISGLLVLSVIDARTFEIPFGINVYLLVLGGIREIVSGCTLISLLMDLFLVSGFLMLLYILTKRKGIGGGDIKLMFAAGALLGWKLTVLALFFGCLYGSVIHIFRMKCMHAGRVLAMGPYLSMGMVTAAWFGNTIISWYLQFFII
ncbi:MAG: prepilin peptidase [Lachnospiraceae bacterium]|nr:prepilin peptidase [Lachnospiraceae bacterium]